MASSRGLITLASRESRYLGKPIDQLSLMAQAITSITMAICKKTKQNQMQKRLTIDQCQKHTYNVDTQKHMLRYFLF